MLRPRHLHKKQKKMVVVFFQIQSNSKIESATKTEFFFREIPFYTFLKFFKKFLNLRNPKNNLFFLLAPKKGKNDKNWLNSDISSFCQCPIGISPVDSRGLQYCSP